MTQLALLVTLRNNKGNVTGILTVKAGERIQFSKYDNDEIPHLRVVPVNGSAPNGCVSFKFSGTVTISDPTGKVIEIIDANFVNMGDE